MSIAHRLAVIFTALLLVAPVPVMAQGRESVQGAAKVSAAVRTKGTVRIMARFVNVEATDAVTAAMQAAGVANVRQIGQSPVVVLEVNAAQLARLLRSGQVEAVQEDIPERANLAESGPLVRAPQAWAAGARGGGWAVAILDTGVQNTHPFLAGRIIAQACFSSNLCPNKQNRQVGPGAALSCSLSGCDHGTHVAGIAAGRNYSGGPGFNGVAPDTHIIVIQGLLPEVEGSDCTDAKLPSPCVMSFPSDQKAALEHIAALSTSIKVAALNMSLGGEFSRSYCDEDMRKPAIDSLRIHFLVSQPLSPLAMTDTSMGSRGPPASALPSPSGRQRTMAPNGLPSSNSAQMVDLLAPGQYIISSVPGSGFKSLLGTSMATPHVAGAFADMRSKNPNVPLIQLEEQGLGKLANSFATTATISNAVGWMLKPPF